MRYILSLSSPIIVAIVLSCFAVAAFVALVLAIVVLNRKWKNVVKRGAAPQEREEERIQFEKELQGMRGESAVSRILGGTKRGVQYVLNNYSAYHEGRTFEVDHILINSRGVFAIETKNWAGEIYGEETDSFWQQYKSYDRHRQRVRLKNPLAQNGGHANHISKILRGEQVNSVIVMAKNNAEHINSARVVNARELRQYLFTYGRPIYSAADMERLYAALTEYQRYNGVSREEHLNDLKLRQERIENGRCPLCGGTLVLKHGRYGDFYGCSNFPRCKFKKNVDKDIG